MRPLITTFRGRTVSRVFFGFSFLLLLTLSVFDPSLLFAGDPAPYWKEHGIKLKNLNSAEVEVLEAAVDDIRRLKPGELKIKPALHLRLSRFDELFGFGFNGPQIADWILERIRKIERKETWTALVNHRKGTFQIGRIFFEELTPLERMYALIHEARHSDGDGFKHSRCPEGFPFVSSRQPDMVLEKEAACDDVPNGAYAFQAAFLFEIYAYGLYEQQTTALIYNSSVARIKP